MRKRRESPIARDGDADGKGKQPPSEASSQPNGDKPLDGELELLRDSLHYVHDTLKGSDGDMAKAVMLVARLSDSVARALLAQQKLLAGSAHASNPEADFDNTLRAMGLGEL